VGATADGRPFLVQELIRGKSLDRVARPLPWREVCELAIGIARGLEAAHRRGILHRDIKPANIMIDEHGVPRLLDFGLAKLTGVSDQGRWPADGAAARDADGTAATQDSPIPEPLGRGRRGGERTAPPGGHPAETPDPPAPDHAGDLERAPVRRGVASDLAETQDAPVRQDVASKVAEAEAGVVRGKVAETQELPAAAGAGPTVRGARAGRDASPSPSPSPDPTSPGAVLGTPRYMAPELWRGEPASAQSDLYSLGAMLYELVAGVAPYLQPEIDEVRGAILAGACRPVGELAPEAHPALAGLVMRCLALEPRDRPASAGVVAHELAAVLVGAPAVPEGNPYRGLRAFDAGHRGLFFGRDADVDAIVDRLRTEPLIAVVGDSGIGKSSVCHAGVVPAVIAGRLGDRRSWRAVSFVPGRAPWQALCGALAEAGVAGAADADAVLRALRPAGDAGVLVVIDQLEELVTLAAPAEAARVTELLAAIAAGGAPGVKALVAVRGDFLTRVAALPELGAPMSRGLHLLRALSAGDLRDAVVGPARQTGVRYETEAMVDQLVTAVAGNPGALPLLQFTLAELWQARDAERGVIPARALDQLGGVDGGLAGHADAVLLGLGAEPRKAARRIVLRLVTAARTRAVRERGELVGDDPVAGAALESLVRGRLVVARDTAAGAPSCELAHEALIRSWGTLRDWLDEEAGQLAARN
ncbi:MAG TPA: serine/threonine-protein kinase, partial [Kofleriaceae bacterium]|nr:serine/threonine-protein kinase [Kofleriaceae bacterium]